MRFLPLLMLAACTTVDLDGPDAQGYRWRKDGPTGTPVIHRGYDIFLNCGAVFNAKSCAVIRKGVCNVYLPEKPQPWLEAHELRHCEGWTHPNPLRWPL